MVDDVHEPEGVRVTFDTGTKALLDASAKAIVSGRDTGLNLFPLNSAFQQHGGMDDIVVTLAERVEHHSGGKKTIRRANADLFWDRVKGINLYLVLCPSGTPNGVVTDFESSMVLVSFGPYSNGLRIGV